MKKILTIIVISAAVALAAFACSIADAPGPGGGGGGGDSSGGTGGSMACFTIVGDYLYTVDDQTLKTTRITDPAQPEYLEFKDQALGFDIETIFPYDGKLFIGSRSAMFIYDVSRSGFPTKISATNHFTSCDPVVAAGNYAYVTLNVENARCGRGTDELQVYDITDLKNPKKGYTDTSISVPKGLGIDLAAERLFVCCKGGLKIYDLSDPAHPVWVDDLTNIGGINNLDTYDVIPRNGLLILVGADGLYQFDYTEENISFVSKIDLRK